MRLLVYCIVTAPDEGFALPEGVRLVRAANLAAAVSEADADPRAEPEQVLAFEAVVEWFHRRCESVVPVRFGCIFADAGAIAALLRERAAEYRRLLADLQGAVEIGIRVLRPAPHTTAASGTAWLAERRRHYAAAQDAAAALQREFTGLCRRSLQESAAGMLSLYFLVPRAGAPAFLERAAQFCWAEGQVLVSGPWPPYSFAAGSVA